MAESEWMVFVELLDTGENDPYRLNDQYIPDIAGMLVPGELIPKGQ